MMNLMGDVVDQLSRPVYGLAQVDRILGLRGGTARRWIDGYRRGGKSYPPVVREEPDTFQPTIRRAKTSITKATYTKPCQVET